MILDKHTLEPANPFIDWPNEELDEFIFCTLHSLPYSPEMQRKWDSIQQEYDFVLDDSISLEEKKAENIKRARNLGLGFTEFLI